MIKYTCNINNVNMQYLDVFLTFCLTFSYVNEYTQNVQSLSVQYQTHRCTQNWEVVQDTKEAMI